MTLSRMRSGTDALSKLKHATMKRGVAMWTILHPCIGGSLQRSPGDSSWFAQSMVIRGLHLFRIFQLSGSRMLAVREAACATRRANSTACTPVWHPDSVFCCLSTSVHPCSMPPSSNVCFTAGFTSRLSTVHYSVPLCTTSVQCAPLCNVYFSVLPRLRIVAHRASGARAVFGCAVGKLHCWLHTGQVHPDDDLSRWELGGCGFYC